MKKIIIGSGNSHKIEEIKSYFSDLDLKFSGLDQNLDLPPVIEDGSSYKENALKKARNNNQKIYYFLKNN